MLVCLCLSVSVSVHLSLHYSSIHYQPTTTLTQDAQEVNGCRRPFCFISSFTWGIEFSGSCRLKSKYHWYKMICSFLIFSSPHLTEVGDEPLLLALFSYATCTSSNWMCSVAQARVVQWLAPGGEPGARIQL